MKPQEIAKPVQLLVEGENPRGFFEALLLHLGLAEAVQVQNFGGVDGLRGFTKALARTPGIATIEAIGCIRDAEAAAPAAPQSVRHAFRAAGWPEPEEAGLVAGRQPRVGLFLLPGSGRPGMLETLCWEAVSEDPAAPCVGSFMECLGERRIEVRNPDKAKVQAFLASREAVDGRVGIAARKGYWPFHSQAFSPLKNFVTALVGP